MYSKQLTLNVERTVYDKLADLCDHSDPLICRVLERWIEDSVEPENRNTMERYRYKANFDNMYMDTQIYALPILGAGTLHSGRINYCFDDLDIFTGYVGFSELVKGGTG